MLNRNFQFGILLLILISSCNHQTTQVPTFPVQGAVILAGVPLANATVIFHVVESKLEVPKPRGKTNSQGKFELTTYNTNDGAPVGKYKVTIELWETLDAERGPTNRLSAKLANPDSSRILVEVKPTVNELQPFIISK